MRAGEIAGVEGVHALAIDLFENDFIGVRRAAERP
jgi:hypothetical protein